MKWGPWSDVRWHAELGYPVEKESVNALLSCSGLQRHGFELINLTGKRHWMAPSRQTNLSIIVNKYENPWGDGRGPVRSI